MTTFLFIKRHLEKAKWKRSIILNGLYIALESKEDFFFFIQSKAAYYFLGVTGLLTANSLKKRLNQAHGLYYGKIYAPVHSSGLAISASADITLMYATLPNSTVSV